jgi:Ca2+-binding RTX toxin-like protein
VQATYWDHWSAFDGELSDDQGSVNAQTFNEVFGVPTAGSGAVPWTPEGTAPSGGAPTAPQGPGTGVVGERPEQSEGGIAPPPVTGGGSPTPSPAPSDPGSSAPPPAATSTTLDGGTSDAPLIGGAGNELIRSGEGAPYMAGGAGADSLVIEAGAGQLTLADFSHADGDRILLDGIAASAVTIEAHSHDGSDGQILLFEGGHAWLPGVHDLTTGSRRGHGQRPCLTAAGPGGSPPGPRLPPRPKTSRIGRSAEAPPARRTPCGPASSGGR